ncbi:hypothetical protein KKF61_05240 [Patescibacteria group bacterium]|nr:hypothetical protein [Patescibacteria group bacterium]MBU0963710.1 hypothetical protein [Patescibacteria group bacterium]
MRVEKKKEQPRPEKFIPEQPIGKVVILIALTVASSALFWLAWNNILTNGIDWGAGTSNILTVVSTLLAFCLMFSLLAISEVLITKKVYLLLMAVVAAGTVFIFFIPSLWSFIGFILVALSFLYWRREVRIDIETRSKFLPHRTIGAGLKFAVTLLLLAICLIYYSFMVCGKDAGGRLLDTAVNTGTQTVNKVLKFYYKDKYHSDQELDEFIISISGLEQARLEFETGFSEIDSAITEGISSAQDEVVAEARNDLLATFDITAEGNETMDNVIRRIVEKNVDKYVNPYKELIPALIALALFFTLNIFSFIYRELIKSFGYLIFHILIWLKFIKVKKVMVEAEKITL